MKTNWVILVASALLMTGSAPAVTNDLSAALQRGLFEEEANHNLEAAIQAYQSVIDQYDKDRKLAATAIFRLGESYRKQGKTNEASAQYERVLREFSDQSALITLSTQNLAVFGKQPAPTASGTSTPAATSAEAEEVKRIQAMIKDSPDLINAMGPDSGGRPLHQAASKGELLVARFLLANGADIEAKNPRYGDRNPLHYAAAAGHKSMVDLLLNKGANVNATDSDGRTALHLAAQNGFRSVVEVLLAQGADSNAKTKTGSTPLHVTVADGFGSVAELLLAHAADVNVVSRDIRSTSGTLFIGTPLHVAVLRNDTALMELLLTHKADVNAVSGSGETPLANVADKGLVKIAELLIANGADVNVTNSHEWHLGWTALHSAAYVGAKDMVELLLKHKADPNIRIQTHTLDNSSYDSNNESTKGYTPLLIATRRGFAEIVDSLLDFNADPNVKSEHGRSPVFNALEHQGLGARMLATLLDHGAEVDARDRDPYRLTPLLRAILNNDKESVQVLLAHKANVDAQDEGEGWAPLHYLAGLSANRDVMEITKLLLKASPDVNLRDKNGKTPLTIIAQQPPPPGPQSNKAKLADLLRQHGALEDVPRPEVIQVRRPSANFFDTPLTKGTNDWNRFTVLEILAMEYDLLTRVPQANCSRNLWWQIGPNGIGHSLFRTWRKSAFAGRLRILNPGKTRRLISVLFSLPLTAPRICRSNGGM